MSPLLQLYKSKKYFLNRKKVFPNFKELCIEKTKNVKNG